VKLRTLCARQLATVLLLVVGSIPGFALAQGAWPSKPVKFINSFPPGGPSDLMARAIADVLQKQFKQPFVVENKPGASGNIGADAVAKAAPDGHTILFGIDSTVTVNPHIYKRMPFKPSDLRPVMVIASSGLLVGVHPSTGFRTMQELVNAGKTRDVSFSSAGSGSPGHLAIEMLTEATGMKITHVPYKGNTPAVTAVVSGEVSAGVLATPGMLPHVNAGKITALAVTSRKRSALAPNVPTVAEVGLPKLEQEVLYVVMLPAATPDPVAKAVENAVGNAMARADVRQTLDLFDLHYEGLAGAAAATRLSELSSRYGQVIRATGMTVE
jgi:tripartite-type tricarboxylate transporter receptor subunit TctC